VGDEKCIKNLVGKPQRKRPLGVFVIDGKAILK
jgi:hypothetical protein